MFRANASCLAFNGVGSKTVRWCYLTCTFPAAIGLQAMPKSARDYGRLKLSLSRVEPGSYPVKASRTTLPVLQSGRPATDRRAKRGHRAPETAKRRAKSAR
jgi:hypothetical protein